MKKLGKTDEEEQQMKKMAKRKQGKGKIKLGLFEEKLRKMNCEQIPNFLTFFNINNRVNLVQERCLLSASCSSAILSNSMIIAPSTSGWRCTSKNPSGSFGSGSSCLKYWMIRLVILRCTCTISRKCLAGIVNSEITGYDDFMCQKSVLFSQISQILEKDLKFRACKISFFMARI